MSRIFGNKPTPTRRWQLGLSVTPLEALATIVVNGRESRGVREAGSGHMLFLFSTPEFTPGAQGVLVVTSPGYVTQEVPLTIGPPLRELDAVTLVRSFPAVQPLIVRWKHFCIFDGTPFFLKHSTQFLAMLRWKRGEDLQPLVNWSHAVGCNGWRVFGQWHNPPNAADRFGPDVLSPDDIRAFCLWLIDRGLRPEVTTLTDCGEFGMSHTAQRERVYSVMRAMDGLAVLNSICNEPMINGCDVYRICDDLGLWDSRMRGSFPMATGDYGIAEQHKEKTFRALDYVGEHPERGANWPAELGKKGHFVYDGWGETPSWAGFRGQDVAVYIEEPRGADEFDHGSRDSNPRNHEDAAAAAKVGAAGYCFHSQAGLEAIVPGPVTTECARRSFAAIELFPADAWGDYTHNELWSNPLAPIMDCTEVISSIVGSRAYSVVTQIGPTAHVSAQNGWRIVRQDGERRNIITLER